MSNLAPREKSLETLITLSLLFANKRSKGPYTVNLSIMCHLC